ncbi:hypothetical protein Q5692_35980 [Microcoleus sp. C2C3]
MPAGARPYPATHHPHRVFGTVGNTSDTSRNAHAVQFERGKVISVATA